MQKSVVFLYTNSEQSEKDIKKTISFTVASKRIKYLGIDLNEEVKGEKMHNIANHQRKAKNKQTKIVLERMWKNWNPCALLVRM